MLARRRLPCGLICMAVGKCNKWTAATAALQMANWQLASSKRATCILQPATGDCLRRCLRLLPNINYLRAIWRPPPLNFCFVYFFMFFRFFCERPGLVVQMFIFLLSRCIFDCRPALLFFFFHFFLDLRNNWETRSGLRLSLSLAYLFLAKIAHFPMLLLPVVVSADVAVVVVAFNQGAELRVASLVAPLPFSPKRLPQPKR